MRLIRACFASNSSCRPRFEILPTVRTDGKRGRARRGGGGRAAGMLLAADDGRL
uniref:Uncharacterized protein n=1 Tax=Arundo donax TaxID=35708 RepID=A0A0A8ZTX6_ARUDO